MENELYSNTKYSFDREESKTIVINVPITSSTDHTFDVMLSELIAIDKHSDVLLDSLTTYNCNTSDNSENNMGFILTINEFEVKSVSNTSSIGRSIFIPNEQTGTNVDTSKTHKGKKLNYICSINPTNINRLSGKITNINGGSIFVGGSGRFIAEFVITSK